MTKSESHKLYPARSESIEPAFAHVIGVMYCRFRDIRDNGGDIVEASYDFWCATDALNLLTITLGNCTHASIVIQNERRKIADMIQEATGLDPILDKDLKMLTHTSNCMNWYNLYDERKAQKA